MHPLVPREHDVLGFSGWQIFFPLPPLPPLPRFLPLPRFVGSQM